MSERLRVDDPTPLLRFLELRLGDWRRATLKERLRLGCVQVNGETTTRHDHPLQVRDEVLVHPKAEASVPRRSPSDLTILYADGDLIALHKPAGLLSVPTEREKDRTALAMVRDSLLGPRTRRGATVWPVHRLDRETSGVLLMATSRELCKAVQRGWAGADKAYLAIVSGHPSPPDGVIDEPLWEDRSLYVHVGRRSSARDARTRFFTQETRRDRALLQVQTDTGRRHQIRAHLAWLGHPIVGDRRYGVAGAGSRLGLHALSLEITDPRTGDRLTFEAPPDGELLALLRGKS